MSPILAYFGHHKCGTTWISAILDGVCAATGLRVVHHSYEHAFAGDIVALKEQTPFEFWRYINADINFTRSVDLLGFHVVRDPRDLIVSAYFSHLLSHPDEDWPRLRHYRPYLRSLPKREGLLAEMEFNAVFLSQMLSWEYTRPAVLECHFEDLVRDPVGSFARIFRFLELVPHRITSEDLEEILERNSFVNLSGGRLPGEEDPAAHYRRGVPGDWRNHFEPVHIDYFRRLYNPLLLKLGYEIQPDWI